MSGARIVFRPFDSDCAVGLCPNGCSHLMWECDQCGSEGGWGVERDSLANLAAKHFCKENEYNSEIQKGDK